MFPCQDASEAVDIHRTAGFKGTLNLSQQVDRMGSNPNMSPCLTPNDVLFNFVKSRPLTGGDKFLLQAFPGHSIDVSCLSEKDSKLHLLRPASYFNLPKYQLGFGEQFQLLRKSTPYLAMCLGQFIYMS